MAKRIQFQMTIGGVPVQGEILEEEYQSWNEYTNSGEFDKDLASVGRGLVKGAVVAGGLALLVSALADSSKR